MKDTSPSIWKTSFTVDELMQRNDNTMSSHLGILFTEKGDDFLSATMPIDQRTKQPIGIMHGGASCVLAETLGSVAANYCVDLNKEYCVGLSINTSHIKAVKQGIVIAKATPNHIGKSTQVWEILIHNEIGQLISKTSLTMAVLQRKT